MYIRQTMQINTITYCFILLSLFLFCSCNKIEKCFAAGTCTGIVIVTVFVTGILYFILKNAGKNELEE